MELSEAIVANIVRNSSWEIPPSPLSSKLLNMTANRDTRDHLSEQRCDPQLIASDKAYTAEGRAC